MKVPQADDLGKVLLLPKFIESGATDSNALAQVAELAPRQVLYYVEAAEILGFVEREGKKFLLTPRGESFVGSSNKKTRAFEALRQIPIIQEVVKYACENGGVIEKPQITELVENRAGLAPATAMRRANSIFNWLYWASYHFPEFCHCEGEQVRVYCKYGEISGQ